MTKKLLCVVYFLILAGTGIIIGCYIHASRVNQTTVMSGVALVRELPFGEKIVGLIETTVFSYQEQKSLEKFQEQYKGKIQIDPEVLKRHQDLYKAKDSGDKK
jgi:hypothetical protein